jgi:bifunctional DNA-binding transcriptional regulator/antitoxin component of YhaV-PrlF toxin-antitoxin module
MERCDKLPVLFSKVDGKGTIVIPIQYRKKFNIEKNTHLFFEDKGNGGFNVGIVNSDLLINENKNYQTKESEERDLNVVKGDKSPKNIGG